MVRTESHVYPSRFELQLQQFELSQKDRSKHSTEVLITNFEWSMCTYKSYCWSMGTTSFRTADFNQKIEKQLTLLPSFGRFIPMSFGRGTTRYNPCTTTSWKTMIFLPAMHPTNPKMPGKKHRDWSIWDWSITNEDRLPPENHYDKSPPTEISDRIIYFKFRPIATFISNRCSKRATT